MLIPNMANVVGIDVIGHQDPLEFMLLGGKGRIIPIEGTGAFCFLSTRNNDWPSTPHHLAQ
jgi:hypothetical protein